MHNIDINFLKDRQLTEEPTKTPTQTKPPTSLEEQLPIVLGLVAVVVLTGFPLGLMLFLNLQTAQSKQNIEQLQAELTALTAQNKKLQEIEAKLQVIDQDTQALVNIFNQIKPWSAVLQEIRNKVPSSVQIKSIQQNDLPSQGFAGGPKTQLSIDGYASSYEELNGFLLTLQRSSFFDPDKTQLVLAKTVDFPDELNNAEELKQQGYEVEMPKVVEYKIVTELNTVPATQLLSDLARNGADGLVLRIQALENKGVLVR